MAKSRTHLVITTLLTSQLLWAQSWLDYDQALSPHSWLRTSNAAALTTYQPTDSSERLLADARLSLSTEHGHLAAPHEAPHSWQANADARSIFRISRRTVLRGGIKYRNMWGNDIAGSVWIDPERMPFDITEVTDTTHGKIALESYELNGEVGVHAGHGWSLGSRLGYTTASYTKRKDPRHTNSLMLMDISAGATWNTNHITLGANYLLQRSTEAVQFRTFGRTDRIYHYLIDQGAYFGREEQTDGKGYVNSDYEKPLLDMRHGLALQGGYSREPWSVVVEWEWAHRHGHYGLESPSLLDLNRHHGDEWHLRSWWQHNRGNAIHRLTVTWNHEDLKDYERTYRIVTDEGITQIIYYDDRELSQRQKDDIGLTYDAQWNIHRHLATWQFHADIHHRLRTITASLYPYYRWQQTHFTELTLTGQRNWLMDNDHTWSVGLLAGWGNGGGTPMSDGAYALADNETSYPLAHTAPLMRQYEWLTASRVRTGITVRWSMPLVRQTRLYAQCDYHFTSANDIHYLHDNHRHTATVALGCMF